MIFYAVKDNDTGEFVGPSGRHWSKTPKLFSKAHNAEYRAKERRDAEQRYRRWDSSYKPRTNIVVVNMEVKEA